MLEFNLFGIPYVSVHFKNCTILVWSIEYHYTIDLYTLYSVLRKTVTFPIFLTALRRQDGCRMMNIYNLPVT